MKIKGLLLLLMALALTGAEIYSQTYYYNETKTFPRNGYTYKCKYQGLSVVYNAENVLRFTKWSYKDGSDISDDIAWGRVSTISSVGYYEAKALATQIVQDSFTDDEKKIAGGIELTMSLMMNDAGNVVEVYFIFRPDSPLARLQVDTYRRIELALKSRVRFNITDAGKQLNYTTTALDVIVPLYVEKPPVQNPDGPGVTFPIITP